MTHNTSAPATLYEKIWHSHLIATPEGRRRCYMSTGIWYMK